MEQTGPVLNTVLVAARQPYPAVDPLAEENAMLNLPPFSISFGPPCTGIELLRAGITPGAILLWKQNLEEWKTDW